MSLFSFVILGVDLWKYRAALVVDVAGVLCIVVGTCLLVSHRDGFDIAIGVANYLVGVCNLFMVIANAKRVTLMDRGLPYDV